MNSRKNNKKVRYNRKTGNYYYLRVMSRDPLLVEPQNLDAAFNGFLEDAGLVMQGCLGKNNDYIHQLEGSSISSVYTDPQGEIIEFVISGSLMSLLWFPLSAKVFPDTFSQHTKVGIDFPETSDLEKVISIFQDLLVHFKAFWGELNYRAITEDLSFCSPNGHDMEFPDLGLLNYFGPEYTRVLGGSERLRSAGFDRVFECGDGFIVSLQNSESSDDFNKKREAVKNNLGGDSIFAREDERWLHKALWGVEPKELIPFDQFFDAVSKLKEGEEIEFRVDGQ